METFAVILVFVKMERHDQEQCEQMEDYCRQLGLQLRDEQENSTTVENTSRTSVLGAAQPAQKEGQNGQPIPPGHAKLDATDKAYFECKKCKKNFTNSRQFLKHRCVLKNKDETLTKVIKGKKRGRKPKDKAGEATKRISDEVNIRLVSD